MFMGGNYLPATDQNEVEIASIRISSTTYDVTCVYAKADSGLIRYRVVDEYEGDTLIDNAELRSDEPLTLSELYGFFMGAWPLFDVLEMNFSDDLNSMMEFFVADSAFYPELDALCREHLAAAFPQDADTD